MNNIKFQLITVYYAVAILLFLPWVRPLWNYIGRENGKIFLYVGFSVICTFLLIKIKNKYFFIALMAVVALIFKIVKMPIERMHFIQYGLLGSLSYFALNKTSHFKAAAFGMSIGVLDEVLQEIIPNRVFDIRDIWMNLIAVGLGMVCAFLYNQFNKTKRIA